MKTPSKNYGHSRMDSYVYGPVKSRRYGTTLGINLLPANDKLCNFDCTYCQLGWNEEQKSQFPKMEIILAEFKNWITAHTLNAIDAIVFSGNGEPTLHPDFSEIVNHISDFLKKVNSTVRMVCFTNGATLMDQTIVAALQKFDEVALKLDPDSKRVNLPDKDLKQTLHSELWFQQANKLHNLTIQSCVFGGTATNSHDDNLKNWTNQIAQLHAHKLDLYTIERDTPRKDLAPLSENSLKQIAAQVRPHLSYPVVVHPNSTANS